MEEYVLVKTYIFYHLHSIESFLHLESRQSAHIDSYEKTSHCEDFVFSLQSNKRKPTVYSTVWESTICKDTKYFPLADRKKQVFVLKCLQFSHLKPSQQHSAMWTQIRIGSIWIIIKVTQNTQY